MVSHCTNFSRVSSSQSCLRCIVAHFGASTTKQQFKLPIRSSRHLDITMEQDSDVKVILHNEYHFPTHTCLTQKRIKNLFLFPISKFPKFGIPKPPTYIQTLNAHTLNTYKHCNALSETKRRSNVKKWGNQR